MVLSRKQRKDGDNEEIVGSSVSVPWSQVAQRSEAWKKNLHQVWRGPDESDRNSSYLPSLLENDLELKP